MSRLDQFWGEGHLSPHWRASITYNQGSYSSVESPSETISESSSSVSTNGSSYSFVSTREESESSQSIPGYPMLDHRGSHHVDSISREILDAKKAIESIRALSSTSILCHHPWDYVNDNNDSSEGWISDSVGPESSRTSTSSISRTLASELTVNQVGIIDDSNGFRMDFPSKIRTTKIGNSHDLSLSIGRDYDSRPFSQSGQGNLIGSTSLRTRKKKTCETPLSRGDLAEKPYPRMKAKYSTPLKSPKYPSPSFHGCFRFVEQDGPPCFSFSLEGSDEVLFARASKPKHHRESNNSFKGDWMYTFYCRKDSNALKEKGGWIKIGSKKKLASIVVSSVIATMKVSKVKAKSRRTCQRSCKDEDFEACFVLFDEREKINGSYKSTIGDVLQNTSPSDISTKKQVEIAAIVMTASSPSVSERNTISNEDCSSNRNSHMTKTHGRDTQTATEERGGFETGWGMNFLGNSAGTLVEGEIRNVSSSCQIVGKSRLQDLLNAPEGLPQLMGTDTNTSNSTSTSTKPCVTSAAGLGKGIRETDVVVVLPSGEHGHPRDNNVDDNDCNDGVGSRIGPTPLLDRWRSGGDCDCGGWDMGCGLCVLRSETTISLHGGRSSPMMALTSLDLLSYLISPGHPFIILTQDSKREKVFVLETMEGGLFSLSFGDQFSPLQAFATAVAIFHQQIVHN